jgi:peptide/nickel transport system ATP-binding protein
MTLLRIENLALSIAGHPVLQGVSLDLARGEILALAGASGSGKSSTALAVARLLPQNAQVSGSIKFDGVELASKCEADLCALRGAEIGLVFQEPMTALNPVMTIGAQIAETLLLHGKCSHTEAKSWVRTMLARVGLSKAGVTAERYPHELSGGQRQRVAIALAIIGKPKLVIADEPTTALDVSTQAQILDLLKSLVHEDNIGLVLIPHDLGAVARVADRVAVMEAGEVVESGSVAEVLHAPRHAITRGLIEAATNLPIRGPRADHERATLLAVERLSRAYRQRGRTAFAISDIDFDLKSGESIAIVGESGSGKSTLLRAILGLERPDCGDVRLAGTSISHAKGAALFELRRKIQAVFQDPSSSFDPRYSVGRIVAEPLHLIDWRISVTERKRRAAAALERVGLPAETAARYPHEFSGGQRQRIAIARALIIQPALIAFDEALSSLDAAARRQLLELLDDLSRMLGLSYLFVTHDLVQARAIADRLIVMQAGRIVEAGNTNDILSAPRHPYTAALLTAATGVPASVGVATEPWA